MRDRVNAVEAPRSPAWLARDESRRRWELARDVLDRYAGRRRATAAPSLAPDALAAVLALIEELRPSRVVELGSGASTVALAGVVSRIGRGQLWSVEHDPAYLETVSRELDQAGLSQVVRLVHAPIRAWRAGWYVGLGYAPDVRATFPRFDLAIIDGPPARAVGRVMSLPFIWDRLAPDAIVIADDASRKLERRWLALWQRMYGCGLAVHVDERFSKGLALMMHVGPDGPPEPSLLTLAAYYRHLVLFVGRGAARQLRRSVSDRFAAPPRVV